MTILGAARQSKLIAVSVAPSINYTSHKKNSTAPYVLTQSLDNAQNIAKHTHLNGKPAYILSQTSQPTCTGDASGIGGGVKSGTVGKEVKPTKGASNIFVEGKPLIRQSDPCIMNNGNTQGKYIALVPATNQTSAASSIFLKALPFIPGGQTISQAIGGISTLAQAKNTAKQGQLFQSAMSVASLIPNPKISQGLGMLNTGMQATQALKHGDLLGGAMSAASLIPNQKVAKGLGMLNTGLQIGQQLSQGAMLDAGMSIAGLIPGSQQFLSFANMGRELLENLKPEPILIKNFATQEKSPPPPPKNMGGTVIKGQGGKLACKQCALANQNTLHGAPVNALYGSKVLSGNEDVDYIGRGYLSFGLVRIYNSQNNHIGWFGQGWQSQGYEQRLTLDPQHNRINLSDNAGRDIPFYYLEPGEYCYQPYENLTLYRLPNDPNTPVSHTDSKPILADAIQGTRIATDEILRYILFTGDYQPPANFTLDSTSNTFAGTALYFNHTHQRNALGTQAIILASELIDNRGHKLQLHYTHDKHSGMAHLPHYITDDAGDCYRLEFKLIDDKPRLTDLHLVLSDKQAISLLHYDYNNEGDLIKVSKQGRTIREFGYTDHLMTWQQLPDGQNAYYRYDQTDHAKTAKVIHHWLDNGQTYHFDYHTDEHGIHHSTVTEQQGDELERTRHYQYNDDYYLTAFTDPNGQQTRYTYDDLNRITAILKPNDSRTLMTYQGTQLESVAVQTTISPLTKLPVYRETHYQYDNQGNLTGIIDALGNQRSFHYNERHDVITSTDALGNQTHFDYDHHGNLIRQTLANGSHYQFDYNELGQMITQTDCSGYTTQYQYDNMGRLTVVTDALGQQTHYYYDQAQTLQTQLNTDNPQESSNEAAVIPNPQLTTAPTQAVYSDGHKEHFIYDEHNRLIQYRDNTGLITHYAYTEDGLPSERTSANGTILRYQYDALRRLTRLTNENDEHWTFTYDKADNLISETRFDGYTSDYDYDGMGYLIHQVDNREPTKTNRYGERHTYLERDLIGQLTRKHCLAYEQDEAAKLHSYSSPFGQPISNQDFDLRPRLNPRQHQHTTHFSYDLLGRLTQAISPDATTTLDYDAVGNLAEECLLRHHPDAQISSPATAIAGGDDEQDSPTLTQTLTHEYDALGNRIATTLPDGKVLQQLYYGSGHLYNQSLCYQQDGEDKTLELHNSERDKLHREISRQQGSLTSQFDYDPMGRLIKQHATQTSQFDERIVIDRGYHYDRLGQLTHIAGKSELTHRQAHKPNEVSYSAFTRNHQYQYDKVGRLVEHKLTDFSKHTGIQERFAFDPASNRVPVIAHNDDQSTNEATVNQSIAVDNKTKRPTTLITQGKHVGYFYDRHGRIKIKTVTPMDEKGHEIAQSVNSMIGYRKSIQFFYNPNNELNRSIVKIDDGLTVTKTTTMYFYDAFGRRIGKSSREAVFSKLNQHNELIRYEGLRQLAKPTKQTMLMLWDGNRQVQEYTQDYVFTTVYEQNSFVPVARLVWLQPNALEKARQAEQQQWQELEDYYLSSWYRALLQHQSQTGVLVYYYHNDHLGTPQELTNSKGEVVWLNYQFAWGGSFEQRCLVNELDKLDVSADELQPFRFQGQMFDVETGLHYNRFRYYDSDVGMFIQRDPIGLMGGNNVFAYAPNPVGWVDPLGLQCTTVKNECGTNSEHTKKSCSQLLNEINDFVYRDKHLNNNGGTHGLIHRFKEQINGKNGPGTQSWIDHEQQICGQQKGLRCRLQAYASNGCGGPPPNAWNYATKPVPTAKEWKNPSNTSAAKVVVGGAAAIGGGYLLYRGLRMIPSLFPPLWPTIPANAAIP